MKTFLRFVLKQRVLINLLFVLMGVVGVFALTSLPLERFPNVQMGKVIITATLPGASPEDVEKLITTEIEDSLDDLEFVEFISSVSYRQTSVTTVKFIDDTDYRALYDELRLKVLSALNELPQNVDPPEFTFIDVSEFLPAVRINLIGERGNRALSLMADEMKLQLRKIPGVREAKISGEFTREFHVALDPALLEKFGVTFDEVAAALGSANLSIPAGDFQAPSGEYVIVVDELFRTRADVAGTVLRRDGDGSLLTVGDVMHDAWMGYRDPFVITSVNGTDAVSIEMLKTSQGDALKILPQVEAVVEEFRPRLEREGVEVVLTQDQRIFINESLSTLGTNLLAGIALVTGIIWLFMGMRNALLTTVGIPFSFLVTMFFMWITGNTLNEITLFAFVLVTGIIVDDAIVVLENIYRHLQEGEPLHQAVVDGAAEVTAPVIAATTTTMAAFLPMLLMTGSTGEFFSQIPIAITAAIVASLFECLIFLPPHFADWPGAKGAEEKARKAHAEHKHSAMMVFLRRWTHKLVDLTMAHRFVTVGSVAVLFVVSVSLLVVSILGYAPIINIKFFPDNYTRYFVDVMGPRATAIEETHTRLKAISDDLLAGGPGQTRSTTGTAGMYVNEDYEQVFGSNLGNLIVEMPTKDEQALPDNPDNDPVLHLQRVREMLAAYEVGGWRITVRPEPDGPPTGKDITARVVGTNPDAVFALAREVERFLREAPALSGKLRDITDDQGVPDRVFRFHVDERRAAEYGLTPERVALLAGSILDGRYIGEFRATDEDVDFKVKVADEYLTSPMDALSVPMIQTPRGTVTLADVTRVETYAEPTKLTRYQNNRAVSITANVADGETISPAFVVRQLSEHLDAIIDNYSGAEVVFGGEFESTQRSYASLAQAFGVAVLIIYMILATQFGSYSQPLIILSAIVFSLIGVIFGKVLTQSIFTVNSFIATVGVTGVVVNDSLVLVDFINRAYRAGATRAEAIRQGIDIRLRPILLTTLTTSLGLMPMAIGIPSYSLVWGSMASTFVAGLATATFLTLFVVPILWDLLTGAQERWGKKALASALD